MPILKLRPHHLNCLFFYEGKGYSEEFVENMNTIIGLLKENPERLICLEKKQDVVCKVCPHLEKGVCNSNGKVLDMDSKTLYYYGLIENKIYSFKQIVETIYRDYEEEKFIAICSGCEWYQMGVCTKDKIKQQKQLWKG